MENKVPVWENIHKRGFIGPRWCALCRAEGEYVVHLFLKCTYCVEVWSECCKLLGLGPECQWEGNTILDAWERWRHLGKVDIMKVLPLLVTWGIWLARNDVIFKGGICTLAITAG